MPNIIDVNGLQTATVSEILNLLLNGNADYPGYLQIYGPNINVNPNSPDGQTLNLFAQMIVDVLDVIANVNAGFDPDQALGRVLDMRCAINGVIRQGATYTQQMIEVTVDQALTLDGLDTAPTAPFTVSDSAGNQFQLVAAYSFAMADTQSLLFRSAVLGAVQTIANTITNIVTVLLGVVSVNNSGAAVSVGQEEETDSSLRVRRANSVSLPSKGYLEGLLGALLDTDGVAGAIVLENTTNGTVNTIPAHSIWCIVLGGTNADVAHAIYVKRNAGCGMKGSVSVAVPQVDGSTMAILFDRPTNENLYIAFTIVPITGSVDTTYVKEQILLRLSYKINQSADTASIVALIKAIAPNASVSDEGVSNDGVTYVSLLAPTAINYQFQIADARIIIT